MNDYKHNILKQYNRWCNEPSLPKELKSELFAMGNDYDKIEEAFFKSLEFGTSGLRGLMGPGTNMMNTLVVAGVTQGLSNYINKTLKKSEEKKKVVISYDSRHNSKKFAEVVAEVLCANDIKTYIFDELTPVSILSFAVKYLEADYGVMITASHNAKEYNGYKVYNATGGQILEDEAKQILAETQAVDIFKDVKKMANAGAGADSSCDIVRIHNEILDAYIKETFEKSKIKISSDLSVVYSPLNGAGLKPVTKLLKKIGVKNLYVVPEQQKPDGNFLTCPKPNPERKEVYKLGLALLDEKNADILILTDPDSDRTGLAEKDGIFTGNQIAVLLFDYLCKKNRDVQGKTIVRSIVSTTLVDVIAAERGVKTETTLIGFKYIAKKAEELGDSFMFAFEEGNGYLAFDHMRDKDGVSSAMLICQMADYYKKRGITLHEALSDIYKQYGFYKEKVITYTFEGIKGNEKRESIMQYLREDIPNALTNYGIKSVIDYSKRKKYFINRETIDYNKLPKSNILEYEVEGRQKFMIRPSGTEPILKAYLFAVGGCENEADKQLFAMQKEVERIIKEKQEIGK